MVTVMRLLLSSYLGDQRGSENLVDFSVAVVEVANLVVGAGGGLYELYMLVVEED
jgi:hypothetical protein